MDSSVPNCLESVDQEVCGTSDAAEDAPDNLPDGNSVETVGTGPVEGGSQKNIPNTPAAAADDDDAVENEERDGCPSTIQNEPSNQDESNQVHVESDSVLSSGGEDIVATRTEGEHLTGNEISGGNDCGVVTSSDTSLEDPSSVKHIDDNELINDPSLDELSASQVDQSRDGEPPSALKEHDEDETLSMPNASAHSLEIAESNNHTAAIVNEEGDTAVSSETSPTHASTKTDSHDKSGDPLDEKSSAEEVSRAEHEKTDPTNGESNKSREANDNEDSNNHKPKDKDKDSKDDNDEDIILVSETRKDATKKANLATVFKCVRCGQTFNSKVDLNKHLLSAHKLIIVSKQKAVECLFCSKKLDMKDFYQHLRSAHKVLLVKSQEAGSTSSDAGKTVSEKRPAKFVDLTCDDDKSAPATSAKNTSGIASSSKNATKHSASLLPLRRTPRNVVVRRYTEPNSDNSSDDNEPAGGGDDDDDDYDPIKERQDSHKSPGKTKSIANTLPKQVESGMQRPVALSVTSSPNRATATSTGVTKSSSNVIPHSRSASFPPITSSHATKTTPVSPLVTSKALITPTLPPQNQTNVAHLKNVNQFVKFNGVLYNVLEGGGKKVMVPIQAAAMPSAGVAPVVSVGVLPSVVTQPHVPNPTPPANVMLLSSTGQLMSTSQSNILQTGIGQQSVLLSPSTATPGNTILLTLPPQQAPNAIGLKDQGQVLPTVNMTIPPASNPQSVTPTHVSQPNCVGVQTPQINTGPSTSVLTSLGTNPSVFGPTVKTSSPAVVSTFAKAVNSAVGQPQESFVKLFVKKPVPQRPISIKAALPPSKSVDPHRADIQQDITIAKPEEVTSLCLHKSGGLFALEVCLDADTHSGTEPKKEPRTIRVIQESETIFVEPPDCTTVQDSEETALDTEKCKVVAAAAISRGHLLPNDLTTFSGRVFFECTRCYACFPQHIQLSLHIKKCSKLAPTGSPNVRIHAPLSVIDEFFTDPRGGSALHLYCKFCRARIVKTAQDYSVRLAHFIKHIEPKVEVYVLPSSKTTNGHMGANRECTRKSLEWIDYIVPPFTLDNPPTSAKNGTLSQYISTDNPLDHIRSKHKKKKKKKKKHKHAEYDSESDDLAGSRLSSLRPKSSRYIGTMRPQIVSSEKSVSAGDVDGGNIFPSGNKHKVARSMMQSFKHIRSPNKLGSTLTAFIPVKRKYRDNSRQGESTRRWNNGKTRSQMRAHWRKPSKRFSNRDHDGSSPDVQNVATADNDVIYVSSDEGPGDTAEGLDSGLASGESEKPELSNSPVTLTEDDISDYVKIIDEAEDAESGLKVGPTTSSQSGDSHAANSDLVDYYGNDVNSTLTCEPIIMEPEQVICYFKKTTSHKMRCQFSNCESEVSKNIRAMLAHIRVHFQILVPMHMLAKCNTQMVRQSIPRPLRLTFSQVQAHFKIMDMEEANLHLGEVQQLYTCTWKNCTRCRCYKKTICAHLIRHIFFTLISKEEYQDMSTNMSAYSPSEPEKTIKKLKIVAVNKAGQKVSMVISIPASQTKSPQLLKAAIKKCLATDETLKVPSEVLTSIAAKFAAEASSQETQLSGPSDVHEAQTNVQEALTQADIDKLRERFPSLLEKWNITDVEPASEKPDGEVDEENPEMSKWEPKRTNRHHCEAKRQQCKMALWKKYSPSWRSVIRRQTPMWTQTSRLQKDELRMIRIHSSKQGVKRKRNIGESTSELPPKRERLEEEINSQCEQEEQRGPNDEKSGKGSPVQITSEGSANELSEGDLDQAGAGVDDSESQDHVGTAERSVEKDPSDENAETQRLASASEGEKGVDHSGSSSTDIEMQTSNQESLCLGKRSESKTAVLPIQLKRFQALPSSCIVKSFTFQKSKKGKRIKVTGRGCGLGLFKCRWRSCKFFCEVMTEDKKKDIVRALAIHLEDVHLKNHRSRPFVFYPERNKSSAVLSSSKFLKFFKDHTPDQDFNKIKLADKFHRLPACKARLTRLDGRKVRMRKKVYHRCAACFFGFTSTARSAFFSHLKKHLQRAHRKESSLQKETSVNDDGDTGVAGETMQAQDSAAVKDHLGQHPGEASERQEGGEPEVVSTSSPASAFTSSSELFKGSKKADHKAASGKEEENMDVDNEDTSDRSEPTEGVLHSDRNLQTVQATQHDGIMASAESVPLPDAEPQMPEAGGSDEEISDYSEDPGVDKLQSEDGSTFAGPKVASSTAVSSTDHLATVEYKEEAMDVDETELMPEQEVSLLTADDASTAVHPPSKSAPTMDMDSLSSAPGTTVQMFYNQLQSYFICYTTTISERKGFGLRFFECPKCGKRNLRGENLPEHLQSHVDKEIHVTPVDGIPTKGPDVSGLCGVAEPESKHGSEGIEGDETASLAMPSDQDTIGYEETDNVVFLTDEEILKRYFTKDISVNKDSHIPFGREVWKCRTCSYQTMTILDTPKHIEKHIMKTVIRKK